MLTAEECSKSKLELFATPPHNVSTQRGDYVNHKPLAQITHLAPLEFHVQISADKYIDLGRTKLQPTLRIAKRSGAALAQDAKVTTANLLLHTLFSQVNCKLNGTLVTANVGTYHYKAYLETILSHGSNSSKSWVQAELYEEDNPCNDNFDPMAQGAQPEIKKNARIKESKTFQLIGRPQVDIFMQDKYLLPGVDINLKFTKSPTQFHLLGGADLKRARFAIIDARLLVRKVKVNPIVGLAHVEELQKDIPAKYPLRRVSSRLSSSQLVLSPSAEKTSSAVSYQGEFSPWDWSPTPLSTATVKKIHSTSDALASTTWACPPTIKGSPTKQPVPHTFETGVDTRKSWACCTKSRTCTTATEGWSSTTTSTLSDTPSTDSI